MKKRIQSYRKVSEGESINDDEEDDHHVDYGEDGVEVCGRLGSVPHERRHQEDYQKRYEVWVVPEDVARTLKICAIQRCAVLRHTQHVVIEGFPIARSYV